MAAFVVLVTLSVGAVIVALAFSKGKSEGKSDQPQPWEEIAESLSNHPEHWNFMNRAKDTSKYRLFYQVTRKDPKIAIGIMWSPFRTHDSNKVWFFDDSEFDTVVTSKVRNILYEAFQAGLAKKLKKFMNPETVNYKDGFFFCPHCGEKVAADVVIQNESNKSD